MKKVVYNACYGGFGLSTLATQEIMKRKGFDENSDDDFVCELPRTDPDLVAVVEELGEKANGDCAMLRIKVVQDKYRITEYDGIETVETPESIKWLE